MSVNKINSPITEFIDSLKNNDETKKDVLKQVGSDFAKLDRSGEDWQHREEERSKHLDNNDKESDIKLKKKYGCVIIIILFLWIVFVISFMCYQVLECCNAKKVSDAVLITLLTSATANILLLPAIVLNYLFPNKK